MDEIQKAKQGARSAKVIQVIEVADVSRGNIIQAIRRKVPTITEQETAIT